LPGRELQHGEQVALQVLGARQHIDHYWHPRGKFGISIIKEYIFNPKE